MPFLIFLLLGGQGILAQARAAPVEGDDATFVAFVNVAVVTMQDEALLEEQTVVVQGERIQSIGPVDTLVVPTGATVIDGSGWYLIPALADMHVHIRAPFADGPLYLNAGITTVLALGTGAESWQRIRDEREHSRTPNFMGPTFYAAGPWIKGGETPEEAERVVRENVEGDFDFVKVHGDVSPEAFDRLHDTATQLGARVIGHGQRRRGMQPVYAHHQDLVHVEEYLYASFNPDNTGFKTAVYASLLVLFLSLSTSVSWALRALWRRVRKHRSSGPSPWSRPVRRWVHVFTGTAWLFFISLVLSVPEPFMGVFAGETVAMTMVGVLLLLVVFLAVVLTLKARTAWHETPNPIQKRATLLLVIGLVWTFVACGGYLTPRSWRTSEAALARIAQETATAGIWVTPTLVVLDYVKRQNTDEFYALIQRPEMRYLRSETRDRWIHDNRFRMPGVAAPMQFAIWRNWTDLMSRLTGELHAADVPFLAGSDAGAVPGVFPGSSLHEELSLLVRAGLTPYEALRTATVNPAIYLDGAKEFGTVTPGFRADLILLAANPLEDIGHISTRVGVMKRGRWFSADELETALEQLAEERK
jgi:hypothetical protein